MLGECEYDLRLIWRGHKRAVPSAVIRLHYRIHVNAIPDGWHVHHLCGNPACSNPRHLKALSHADHVQAHREMKAAARASA